MSDRKSQNQSQNQNSDKKDEAEYIANRYRIEEKKRGEKGATYLVTDTKINDELKCIKVLNVSTTNRNELKEIIREENVLSQIDNPYIVKYYESFINNDTICIVTEYCDGGDLAHKIREARKQDIKFSEEKIVFWFTQLLSACFYLQKMGILHRNIKPGNIYLKNGNVKLGDFGISRVLKGQEDASTFTGTPNYMSPEVVQNEKYNYKSDVWSIGCVLYELATFQRPFVADHLFDLFKSIVNDETPSILNIYSKDLNRILKMTLIKNQRDRPSAEELLNEEYLVMHTKLTIKKSLQMAETPDHVASLINSIASLGEILNDESFGDYDERSTLKSTERSTDRTPRNSMRSNCN